MSESKTETTPDATEYKGKVNLVSSEGDKFEVETKTAAMSELVKSTFFIYFFIFFLSGRKFFSRLILRNLKKKKVFVLVALQAARANPRHTCFPKTQHTPVRCVRVALRLKQSFPFSF